MQKKVDPKGGSSNQSQKALRGVSKLAPRGVVEAGGKNSYLPFCSERYKMVDLGKWLDEKYVIPDDTFTPSPNHPKEDES